MLTPFAPAGALFIPLLIVAVAVAFVLAVRFISSRYKKIPPNAVGVFYGRKYKDPVTGLTQGFLVISGGGRILYPLVEEYMEMSTSAFQIEIDETGIPNKDNVRLTVRGVASCQLSPTPEDLNRAAQSFLGKQASEVELFIANILKGHLRSIIGKMNIDEILRERDKFNARVIEESSTELKRVGIDVINLVIQDVNDNQGYIDALGRQAVADAKAEAEIRVADANRRQSIAVSDANRESDLVKAGNEAKVAEANKERDIKKAAFLRETSTVQAEADMAGQIAKAAQEQRLKVAEAERDAAEREAQVKVQEKEAIRRTKELEATVVAQARADQQRSVIAAEAGKQKRVIDADAEAEYLKRTAQAKRDAATLEGEGEANRKKAVLLAEAEGRAAEKKQALLAEAEGTQKLAEALAQMSTDARFILVLDKLPNLLDHGGDALAKTLQAMFASVAAGLGQIDRISIVDMGGGGQSVNRVAELVPQIVFSVLSQLKARGIDLSSLLRSLKIDASGLESLLAGVAPETSPRVHAAAHPAASPASSAAPFAPLPATGAMAQAAPAGSTAPASAGQASPAGAVPPGTDAQPGRRGPAPMEALRQVENQVYAISPSAAPRALVVSCGDPRFQEPVAKFLDGELGLHIGEYVPLVVAGGVASLTVGDMLPKEAKFVREAVALYLELFASLDRIVLINHEDCGKYKALARTLPCFLRHRDQTLADRQKEDLQHSVAALTAHHGIAVESYYAAFSNPSRTLVHFEKQLWPT